MIHDRSQRVAGRAPVVLALFAILTLGCGSARGPRPSSSAANTNARAEPPSATDTERRAAHTCGMHPQVREDGPGACPICGMDLVPERAATEPAPAAGGFTCSMHPQIASAEPGTCPICGMDLIPRAPGVVEPELPTVDLSCAEEGCRRAAVRRLLDAALRPDQPSSVVAAAVTTVPDDALTGYLRAPDGLVRSLAAIEVARRRLVTALGALRSAASNERQDPQGIGRMSAMDALARLGDASASELLRPWLDHEAPVVRLIAAGLAERHPALREELSRVRRGDPSADVRDEAELSLAMLGDPAARAQVLRRTDARSFRVRARLDPAFRDQLATIAASEAGLDGMAFVRRESAVFALLDVGDERGRPAAHRMLESATELQELPLLQTLHQHATEADLAVVVPRLAHRDPLVRVQAAATWWRIAGRPIP